MKSDGLVFQMFRDTSRRNSSADLDFHFFSESSTQSYRGTKSTKCCYSKNINTPEEVSGM